MENTEEKKDIDNVVILNHQPRALNMSSPDFTLIPGENDVPRDVLTENINNPNGVVKSWFSDLRYCSILKGAKKAKALAADLSTKTAKEAIALIEKIEHISILKTWAGNENRSTVTKAITKRLGDLANPEEESSGD